MLIGKRFLLSAMQRPLVLLRACVSELPRAVILAAISSTMGLLPLSAVASPDDDVEQLYRAGKYEAALPLYRQAAEETGLAPVEKVRRLRYLGDCLAKCEKPQEALAIFRTIESVLPAADHAQGSANAMDQSVCAAFLNDTKLSQRLALVALQEAKQVAGVEGIGVLARASALRAYIDYVRADYADAAREFEEAIALNQRSDLEPLRRQTFVMKLNFAAGGAYYHLGQWAKSTECFAKMHAANEILFGKNDLQTGWSHLALSDTLRKEGGDNEKWKEHYAEAVRIFRRFNRDKLIAEYSVNIPVGQNQGELERRVTSCVFGSSPSADAPMNVPPLCANHLQVIATHDPASVFVRPFEDPPGRVWANPWIAQKGMVIGVHGLSLQHSSYDALAHRLADAGYTMVAFDMRGFGTYRQAMGADRMDFDGCMEDLSTVVRSIHGGKLELPMFILGESMGGAIAMQFTAQHPELVTGLISSVPAGKRYKQKKTALRVAITYLLGKDKPINIGADVINQATTDPHLKSQWTNDPLNRSSLSPSELIHFQEMMNRNIEHAKRITETPVIVFQGVSDKLVKPDATYELFRAIGAKDKSLVMIGNTEHLIFEEGCFSEPVLAGLLAWMDSHRNVNGANATQPFRQESR